MKNLVVFTGAGISAESGIKTFRDSDGLWEGYQVEEVATPNAWLKNPELVLRFYNERRRKIIDVEPNIAHQVIVDLENHYNVFIITQNIDDLHERAGSTHITHLHGEIFKMRSEKNASLVYPIHKDINIGELAEDGAQLRPHIVWFYEDVPMMDRAIEITKSADIFVVIGTSLVVYPAASLLNYLNEHTPVYVVDKKVPNVNKPNVIYIEKPATEGMLELKELLL